MEAVGNWKPVMDKHLEDVLILADRLAMLHYHYAEKIIEKLGDQEGRALIEAAILSYGQDCGLQARDRVALQGCQNTIDNHHLATDLPSCGWKTEVLQMNANHKLIKTDFCPMAKTWKRYKKPLLGRYYCQVDQAKYMSYNDSLLCTHDCNVMDGDDHCLIRIDSQSEK